MSHRSCHAKTWFILVLILLVLAIAMIYSAMSKKNQPPAIVTKTAKIEGVLLPKAQAIPEFSFFDQYEKPFTQKNLKGKWTLLFFGFTNCGYVCPTTLTELKKMMVLLQKALPSEQLPQVVFVSVDPERDTGQRLREYMTAFNPQFIAIHSTLSATEKLEEQMHIAAIKLSAANQTQGHDNYTVDHSAEILVINPDARLQAYLSYPHQAEQMVKDYQEIIRGS